MSASHGSNADVVGNGYVLSEFLNSVTSSGSRDPADTTTFKNKSKTYIPGLKDTSMSAEGIYDGDADAVDEILSVALSSDTPGLFSYFPNGQEVFGNASFTLPTIETTYEITTDVGDVAQVSAELQAGQNGRFSRGFVIHSLAAEAVGGNGSSLDGAAASIGGGGLVVHSVASTALSVTLQDSADAIAWADVSAAVDIAAGRGSVRVEVAGTIRRYTRVLWTGAGTFIAIVERY